MTRRTMALVAALAIAAGLSCRDQSSGAGTLRVRLTMPQASSGNDGAILFTITGPAAPVGVTASASLRVFNEPLSTTTKYAVTGTLTGGATIMTFNVNDVRQSYTATIQQVAMSSYQLRAPLTGYSLSVIR